MPRTISVPDFDFAGGFYYADVLERLIAFFRVNVPEITNESPGEPAIQLLRAFALTSHLNAVLLDIAAHESLMVTAQLRDSLVAHLKLIDYEVAGDIPASVQLVLTLARTFTATEEVVPDGALFSTRRGNPAEPVVFEADAAVSVTRTDQVTACFVYDASGPTWTDRTSNANTDLDVFQVLPATPAAGDIFYVGHDSVMTNRLRIGGLTIAMGVGVVGVWEYCDDLVEESFPDSVAVAGSGVALTMVVDGLLDAVGVSRAGAEVVVTLNSTGAQETRISTWDGTNNRIETSGFLGQTDPSIDERDYTIGTRWHRLDGLEDDTSTGATTMQQNGDIDFVLPKTVVESWEPIEVNGVTAYWLRFRVISAAGTITPATIDRVYWNKRDNFVSVETTQGRTRTETLGSSTGLADQSFTVGVGNVIPGTVEIEVDGAAWDEVENFLSSTAVDEDYTVTIDSDGVAVIEFGNGVNGAIPPLGVNNIVATYRSEANTDGNVGAETVTSNRSGVAGIKRVTNPRPAAGWVERRGATAEDRERLKLEGPASLRTLGRAVTVADVEYLAVNFTAADGSKPFVRCKAIEFGFGDKTVKAVVVGPAGAATSAAHRRELEAYFNGDPDTGASGVMVANQRVFVRDYVSEAIPITGTVTGGNEESIRAGLLTLLSPVAVQSDGITYVWGFGDDVPTSKIISTVFAADPDVTDFVLTLPVGTTTLDADQLPTAGTFTLTFL